MTARQGRVRAGLLLVGLGVCAAAVGLLLPRTPAVPPSGSQLGPKGQATELLGGALVLGAGGATLLTARRRPRG